jgi:DNA-binding GntR family transcriptional regulator
MVETKNNKINLHVYLDKDKFANKKIGEVFPNLEDQVYKITKNKIIWHEIKMGERIIDKKLAEELGVSRSMVRQVLTILAKEEILTIVPRNGFYVKEITRKEIEEIYNIRKILEAYATELAVSKIGSRDIAEVEEVFKKAKGDLEKDEVKSFIETDAKLHKLLIDNCGNEYLKKTINEYNDRYAFYRVVDLSRVERAKESYFEHYEIFKAVKEKKEGLSAKLMAKHIENAKNIILNNFDSYTFGNK